MADEIVRLRTPLDEQLVRSLRAGQQVALSGQIYTARDAAHKRFCEAMAKGLPLPFEPSGAVVYFVGPTPARPGRAIGAAGPTTASRMDLFTPILLAAGLRATIGKGYRSTEVRQALARYGAVHLAAIGGAGAYLSRFIIKAEPLAYPDLGPEAVLCLTVEDLPTFVAYDSHGGTIYVKDKG